MSQPYKRLGRQWIFSIYSMVLSALLVVPSAQAVQDVVPVEQTIGISFADTPLNQAFKMLAKLGGVNVLLAKDVSGTVTATLSESDVDTAIRTIADISGYAVQKQGKAYWIVARDDAGKDIVSDDVRVKTFKVRYLSTDLARTLLEKYLSRYGSLTAIPERKLLVVEDRPAFVERVAKVLKQVDVEPQQILIEAKILEISLRNDETYGIDWSGKASNKNIGTTGFSQSGSSNFFFEYFSDDLNVVLKSLAQNGRVRTLATPKLLVLEDQEAEVIIGDRIGFRVTTTINEVTSESVEFIKSGVILKVKAAVDNDKRIMLDIHPEVSSGTIENGIPSVKTTEVTTQLIAEDAQPIFIGGLIKSSVTEIESGVPVLKDVPVMGKLFSRTEDNVLKTETIVLITPYLLGEERRMNRAEVEKTRHYIADLEVAEEKAQGKIDGEKRRLSSQQLQRRQPVVFEEREENTTDDMDWR